MKRLLILLAMLLALGMAPPELYEEARRTAPMHAQLEVLIVVFPRSPHGLCVVKGSIVEVFRDREDQLSVGDNLILRISCSRNNAKPPPPSDTLWTSLSRLSKGQFLEAFLNSSKTIPMDQVYVIDEPSSSPRCAPESKGPKCLP